MMTMVVAAVKTLAVLAVRAASIATPDKAAELTLPAVAEMYGTTVGLNLPPVPATILATVAAQEI